VAELIPHQLRELEQDVARRIAAPFDAIFDMLEESATTLHSQAEALEAAGRALQEAASLMKRQADMFERSVGTLRQPAELAKLAAGLERHGDAPRP
jgi:exonuclease VII small subunit